MNHISDFINFLNAVSAIPVSVPFLKIPKDVGQNLYLLQEFMPSLRFFATICKASRWSKNFKIFEDLHRGFHLVLDHNIDFYLHPFLRTSETKMLPVGYIILARSNKFR